MEKKKLLFVAISVGVFLTIVIGAAILILSPTWTGPQGTGTPLASTQPVLPGQTGTGSAPLTTVPSTGSPAVVDPADMVRNGGDLQSLQTPPAVSATAGTAAEGAPAGSEFHISGGAAATSPVVITVPKPATLTASGSPAAKSSDTPASPEPPAASGTSSGGASSPAPVSTPAAAVQPAPKPAAPAAPQTYTAYWVQTGSFSNKLWADQARETLTSKGISSVIENRVVDGVFWYRVRVGPYTSSNEANYWLALIKTIEGFENSQVWQNQVQAAALTTSTQP
ncbi:MAG: SPOR domain-containing protein [Treponema sp.]|jgi:DedD protein|nr:SPOR domain-containing protein [Treponema sp.]